MARFTDLLKSFVSPPDKIQTPSFIKTERSTTPSVVAPKTDDLPQSPGSNTSKAARQENITHNKELPSKNTVEVNSCNIVQPDKIDVPVYQNDSEWDVVQRSINLFADHANLNGEIKEAFVKKWVAELKKADQTSLYRNEEDGQGHLGNEINRANADGATGLLGTFQAMIHPGRQARMNDELKALQCIEKFDLGVTEWQLCRDFKRDLIMIAIGTIEDQKRAAQNLFEKAQKGRPEADKIYAATKALSSRGEMRLNSAIKTAVIKMDTAKYQINKQAIDLSDLESAASSVIVQTPETKKSEHQKNAGRESNKEVAKPKISESSWVDEQALRLFGNTRS
jgi:hypothetical protein